MSRLARLIRRRRLALVAGLGLAAALGWIALWIWSDLRWLAVDPVAGPLPRGSLIASLQRGFDDVRTPSSWGAYTTGDSTTVRIEPGTGSHRDLFNRMVSDIRVSPDGRSLAYRTEGATLWVGPVEGGEAAVIPGFSGYPAAWSPDGSAILSTAVPGAARDRIGHNGTWRFAVSGFERTRLDLPDTEAVMDWSRDGRWLLTLSSRDLAPGQFDWGVYRMAPDGSDALRLSPPPDPTKPGVPFPPRFSPDGRRVAYSRHDYGTKLTTVWVVDVDGTGLRALAGPVNDRLQFGWSPNGKSLVVHGYRDAFLIDADGANRRPLGLRWQRKLNFDSNLLPAMLDSGADPRRIGAIEWVDLPGRPR